MAKAAMGKEVPDVKISSTIILFLLLSLPAFAENSYPYGSHQWQGAYGSLHLGGTLYDGSRGIATPQFSELFLVNDVPSSIDPEGTKFSWGANLGYNFRYSPRVLLGFEVDIAFPVGTLSDSVRIEGAVDHYTNVDLATNWLGALRGRVGYLAKEDLFIFLTAGLAFGSFEQKLTHMTSGNANYLTTDSQGIPHTLNCHAFEVCVNGKSDQLSIGWTLGAGFEYAISEKIRFRTDYIYTDFGLSEHKTLAAETSSSRDVFLEAGTQISLQQLRIGLSFAF